MRCETCLYGPDCAALGRLCFGGSDCPTDVGEWCGNRRAAAAGWVSLAVERLWKVPPDFGEDKRTGLYFWTHLGLDFPVFPPHTWLLEHVVLPNFTAFGWSLNYRLPSEATHSLEYGRYRPNSRTHHLQISGRNHMFESWEHSAARNSAGLEYVHSASKISKRQLHHNSGDTA
jgi:hypothetical protein